MDIIDILGGMLNRKSGGSGKGPDILRDILRGGKRSEPERRSGPAGSPPTEDDLHQTAKELEDLLNIARDRDAARRSGEPQQPRQPAQHRQAPPQSPAGRSVPVDSPYAGPAGGGRQSSPRSGRPTQDEQALVLVRAMVNAAKADGQITADEQQSILDQFGDQPDVMQFLRDEMRKPLDVREFAWSVPLGMEQQVFAMSLLAISADSRAEADYLGELAQLPQSGDKIRQFRRPAARKSLRRLAGIGGTAM